MGETLRFTPDSVIYSINGNRVKVGEIAAIKEFEGGIDLTITSDPDETGEVVAPSTVRLLMPSPTRIVATAEAQGGGGFMPIRSAELKRVFDLQRCEL